jgi:rhodanese-related sulfurtransferase/DNA-binding transcriptional ArsR family regulator
MGRREAKQALFEQFARVAKAMSNPKRLEILDLLVQGERPVEALARSAGLGLTSTSAHLQTLKQANLVATRRDGTRIYYRLAAPDVLDLYARLQQVAAAHLADLTRARAHFLGPDDTEEVDREELWRRAQHGDVVVIDVRPREEYAGGHIPGAVSMPLDTLAARLSELPEDTEVVAYCRGAYCVLSYDAVRLLNSHGRRARRLRDGMLEWRLAELPVAAAQP